MRKEEVLRIVNEILPQILEEHPELRNTVERIVREKTLPRDEAEARFERMLEHLERLYREIVRLREESEKRWAEWQKRWEESKAESEKRWAELKKEGEKRWAELKVESDRRWEELKKEIHRVEALGARWGIFPPGCARKPFGWPKS